MESSASALFLLKNTQSKALVSGNDFSFNKDGIPLEKQIEIFDKLFNEKASEINNLRKKD